MSMEIVPSSGYWCPQGFALRKDIINPRMVQHHKRKSSILDLYEKSTATITKPRLPYVNKVDQN